MGAVREIRASMIQQLQSVDPDRKYPGMQDINIFLRLAARAAAPPAEADDFPAEKKGLAEERRIVQNPRFLRQAP